MRRVSHSERAPPLDQLNKRNRNPSKGGGGSTGTPGRNVMARHIVARHALSPSTPRAFRRDPPGSGGGQLSAAKQWGLPCHQCPRTALARTLLKRRKRRNADREKTS